MASNNIRLQTKNGEENSDLEDPLSPQQRYVFDFIGTRISADTQHLQTSVACIVQLIREFSWPMLKNSVIIWAWKKLAPTVLDLTIAFLFFSAQFAKMSNFDSNDILTVLSRLFAEKFIVQVPHAQLEFSDLNNKELTEIKTVFIEMTRSAIHSSFLNDLVTAVKDNIEDLQLKSFLAKEIVNYLTENNIQDDDDKDSGSMDILLEEENEQVQEEEEKEKKSYTIESCKILLQELIIQANEAVQLNQVAANATVTNEASAEFASIITGSETTLPQAPTPLIAQDSNAQVKQQELESKSSSSNDHKKNDDPDIIVLQEPEPAPPTPAKEAPLENNNTTPRQALDAAEATKDAVAVQELKQQSEQEILHAIKNNSSKIARNAKLSFNKQAMAHERRPVTKHPAAKRQRVTSSKIEPKDVITID